MIQDKTMYKKEIWKKGNLDVNLKKKFSSNYTSKEG